MNSEPSPSIEQLRIGSRGTEEDESCRHSMTRLLFVETLRRGNAGALTASGQTAALVARVTVQTC